jgi:cyclase
MKKPVPRGDMFYGATPYIFRRAAWLRYNMTPAEKLLWEKLRKKQLGVRFKAQHPMGRYIVDFYCHQAGLVVEIDGPIHNYQKEEDQHRTDDMKKDGITLLRFKNEEVFENIEGVLKRIRDNL